VPEDFKKKSSDFRYLKIFDQKECYHNYLLDFRKGF
jgi:hypothetical protein